MSVLRSPIVTEKATLEGETQNRFTFLVDPKANKIEISNAVASHYGVRVEKVRTQRYAGKRKDRSTKSCIVVGRKNHVKKAIVTLAQGDSIDFYSNL